MDSNQKEAPLLSKIKQEPYKGQPWYDAPIPTIHQVTDEELHRLSDKVDLVLLTATETELDAVLRKFVPWPDRNAVLRAYQASNTFYLGKFGAQLTAVTLCGMTSSARDGSVLTTSDALRLFNPLAIVMIGIAFGKYTPGHDLEKEGKQEIADVLVSTQVVPYEYQRINSGDEPSTPRSPHPPAGRILLNRFKNVLGWEFFRPDGSKCERRLGPILSGDKLIDDYDEKVKLIKKFPDAIGGEMEGAGLYAAADRENVEWILVKAICDWADGNKHKKDQPLAAAAAVSLVHYVMSDMQVLKALRRGDSIKTLVDHNPTGYDEDQVRFLKSMGYVEIEFIEQGSSGSVYRARNVDTGVIEAIKCIQKRHLNDSDIRAHLRRGFNALEELHKNCEGYCKGAVKPLRWIDGEYAAYSMEFILGKNLSAYKESPQFGLLTLEQKLSIYDHILTIIETAHDCNIVHRDLSPENILIRSRDAEVFISDFDMAYFSEQLFTVGNRVIGAYLYTAPEAYAPRPAGIPPDKRLDVFSLGRLLHFLLLGPPNIIDYAARNDYRRKLLAQEHVPPGLVNIILNCTNSDPKRRYDDVTRLRRDFDQWQKNPDHLPALLDPTEDKEQNRQGLRDKLRMMERIGLVFMGIMSVGIPFLIMGLDLLPSDMMTSSTVARWLFFFLIAAVNLWTMAIGPRDIMRLIDAGAVITYQTVIGAGISHMLLIGVRSLSVFFLIVAQNLKIGIAWCALTVGFSELLLLLTWLFSHKLKQEKSYESTDMALVESSIWYYKRPHLFRAMATVLMLLGAAAAAFFVSSETVSIWLALFLMVSGWVFNEALLAYWRGKRDWRRDHPES